MIEVTMQDYEPVLAMIPESTRKFLSGVFKMQSQLLSVIDLDKVTDVLNQNSGKAA